MTWNVALPMYNVSPRLRREYESFAASLLAQAEVTNEVELLSSTDLPSFWRRDDVLLTQTCGYPYMTTLRDNSALLATPCYDFPGCEGADYASAIITRTGSDIQSLADARGRIAAANDPQSNSGMNVLRHAVAPLAWHGRFFGEVRWTGSHAASLRMVKAGEADIAAIDCVTYGYLKEEDADSVHGITILQYTKSTPGLPLIAAQAVPEAIRERMRNALLDPGAALRDHMRRLRISGFEACTNADYERILQLEATALALGYPKLN
ncbi:ABC-type phosphate/phosphonate transport system substrate-binding protein [Duganella sp. 1224]|uniref:phosphate/phosphite/phosphonate ABC transporter substrate-binding protein n=1 Tax=Duganella sp. 1224 TaxID=2587052 RepID=UPI00178F9DA1|nr:PhnD/SsuA/transferrin family substrate-binding protein [Duganella sp. 1224]NYE59500.1 ABC-type phosphate/phosphonate transport system substrate-binding protein [Duganella sp. 1224]